MAKGRMKRQFVVFSQDKTDTAAFFVVGRTPCLSSTADCLRWIKEHGEPGNVYQPACFNGPLVSVEVTEQRGVVPIVQDSDMETCPSCGGHGAQDSDGCGFCEMCNGRGTVRPVKEPEGDSGEAEPPEDEALDEAQRRG